MDHPSATRRTVSEDLTLSFPNVCRLVASFQDSGIVLERSAKQVGKRGPMSKTLSLKNETGCTLGIDVEATQLRAVGLDYANEVFAVLRKPISAGESPEDLVAEVAKMASELVRVVEKKGLQAQALGLALPGPLTNAKAGRVRTDLQSGISEIEFVPQAEKASGLPTFASDNTLCFALLHHRFFSRERDIVMVVLNRFGLGASVIKEGEMVAGELGLLPYRTNSGTLHYREVCTGASLLRFVRQSGDARDLQALLSSPDDPLLTEWLETAVPAFAQAIYSAIVLYRPNRVVVEGIFSGFLQDIRHEVSRIVADELAAVGLAAPPIGLYEGSDLSGAQGAALMARDRVADEVLVDLVRSARS